MNARLFASVMSMSMRRAMSYRADFWIMAVVGFVAQIGLVYYLWEAIFRESGQTVIAGFTRQGMLIYYITATLVAKLSQSQAGEGIFSSDIYEGSLSRYIVYPTDYFVFKYAQRLGEGGPALIQFIAFASVSWLIVGLPEGFTVTPASVAMFAVSVIVAFSLIHLICCPIDGVAFWADNVWSLNVMVRFAIQLLGGGMLPLALYPQWAQEALRFTPFPYVVSVPIRVLLGEVGFVEWMQGLAIAGSWMAVLMLMISVVWRRGYLQYTGVGM